MEISNHEIIKMEKENTLPSQEENPVETKSKEPDRAPSTNNTRKKTKNFLVLLIKSLSALLNECLFF